jgi:hypothetical protein
MNPKSSEAASETEKGEEHGHRSDLTSRRAQRRIKAFQ